MENIRKSEKKQQTETCALWLKIRMPKRNAKCSTIIHTPTHSNHQFWGQSFRFRSPPGILYAYTLGTLLHLSLLLLNKAAGEELLPNHCLHQGIANSPVPGMEMTHNSSQRLAFKVRTGDCRNFDLWHKTISEKSDSQLHTSDNTSQQISRQGFWILQHRPKRNFKGTRSRQGIPDHWHHPNPSFEDRKISLSSQLPWQEIPSHSVSNLDALPALDLQLWHKSMVCFQVLQPKCPGVLLCRVTEKFSNLAKNCDSWGSHGSINSLVLGDGKPPTFNRESL